MANLTPQFKLHFFIMYAIVDIETTGGFIAGNQITEIAIITHDGNNVTGQYQTLVNPGCKIPSYITGLTGISNAMVASAPDFHEVADTIFSYLDQKIFVAHNVNFDFSFVKHQLEVCGYALKSEKVCTISLSRKLFPGQPSYSLGKLCNSLGIEVQDRHRAYGDAKATSILFEMLLQAGAEKFIKKSPKTLSSIQK
jgi:DNA polymerase-3 subunit epsilon